MTIKILSLITYFKKQTYTEWLKEYYEEESWNAVSRWLANIDSTLRETFSLYMDIIKNIKN